MDHPHKLAYFVIMPVEWVIYSHSSSPVCGFQSIHQAEVVKFVVVFQCLIVFSAES